MERVEDVLVQLGIDVAQQIRLAGIGVNLVFHIEVIECRDAHKRLWLLLQVRRLGGSSKQNVVSRADPLPASSKEERPTQAPAPTQPPTKAPPKTTVTAVSRLDPEDGHTYEPEQVLSNDGDCWCPKKGSGVNSWIKLNFSEPKRINGIDIVNGYAGSEEQYENNSKVKRIKIELSNGKSYTETLTVKSVDNRKDIQHISFNTATTSYVKITILSIQKGEEYDDTCITYISPTAP